MWRWIPSASLVRYWRHHELREPGEAIAGIAVEKAKRCPGAPHFDATFMRGRGARGRLPIWLALLMPFMALLSVFGLTIGFVTVLWTLHRARHPDISFASKSDVAFPLIVFPAFLGAVAPALMLLNFALACIPPLRRIFEGNAEGVKWASYQASMSALWKVARIHVPPALVLALLGAVEPWASYIRPRSC